MQKVQQSAAVIIMSDEVRCRFLMGDFFAVMINKAKQRESEGFTICTILRCESGHIIG